MTVATKNKINEKEQEWLNEEVEFEFFNIEEPGSSLTFSYGPANNIKTYTLRHGDRYKYARRLINHVESKGPSNWVSRPDGRGGNMIVREGNFPRFQCKIVFTPNY